MKLTELAYRNVKRNKRRSVFSGFGIAIMVMVITFMFAMINGMMGDYRSNIHNYVTGHIRIRNTEYDKLESQAPLHLNIGNSTALLEKLEGIKNVKGTVPRIQFGTMIYGSPRLSMNDIKDFREFITYLTGGKGPLAVFLMSKASPGLKGKLSSLSGQDIPQETKVELLDYLNKFIQRITITNKATAGAADLPDEAKRMAELGISMKNRDRYNRLLLETVIPEFIEPTTRMEKSFMGMGMGVDFEREKKFINFEKKLNSGTLPAPGMNEVMLSSGLAKEMNLLPGDKITLYTKTKDSSMNAVTLRITAISTFPVAGYNNKLFFIPLGTVQKLLRMPDSTIDILVITKNGSGINNTVNSVNNELTAMDYKNVTAVSWEGIGIYSAVSTLAWVAYIYIAAFLFLLGSTIIIITTMMVILERMREIGTIAAMGMKGKEIVKLFFLESAFIAIIGAGVGVILGVLVTLPLSIFGMDMTAVLEGVDFEMNAVVYPVINPFITIFVFVYAVAISSAASFIPSRKASRIEPVEALRTI